MKAILESWPDWLTQAVIAAYQGGKHPAEIGATIGRREGVIRGKLIRGKLIREGVYISAAAQRKAIITQSAEGF